MIEESNDNVESAVAPSSSNTPSQSVEANNSSPPVVSDSTPVEKPQRTFTQEQLNEIVGREKAALKERMLRNMSTSNDASEFSSSQSSAPPDMKRMMRETIQEEQQNWANQIQQQQQEEQAKKIAYEFYNKINVAKQDHPELPTQLEEVGIQYFPNLVGTINGLDNTVDVLSNLIQDPAKMYQLEKMISENSNLGLRAIKQYADAIKQNKTASTAPRANEPLSQLQPSTQGMNSKGALTVSDYRRKYKV